MIEHEYIVIAVHGEGDRETVNALQTHRTALDHVGTSSVSQSDEPPDVMILLRDEVHNKRIELPVHTWDEVEMWKEMIGWDQDKRHWKSGAKVKVGFSI
jgi:hypothetical protein